MKRMKEPKFLTADKCRPGHLGSCGNVRTLEQIKSCRVMQLGLGRANPESKYLRSLVVAKNRRSLSSLSSHRVTPKRKGNSLFADRRRG